MRRTAWVAWACLVALGGVLPGAVRPVHAAGKNFIALMTGGQEVPPTGSEASGIAYLFINAESRLCYSITTTRLEGGSEVASHVHGPAGPGVSANPLFSIPETGLTKNGCVGPLTKSNKKDLSKGLLYLNIHTQQFQGGEIRGQILPTK